MKKFEVFGIKGLAFQKLLCWISQTLTKLNTPTGKCMFK